MADSPSREIEALVSKFYSAFDNRGSRRPSDDELRSLFDDKAVITRVVNNVVEKLDLDAFISPRISILTDGTLTDFHEWETDAHLLVFADIASRWSTYEKEGRLNGASHRGGGQKFMHFHRARDRWWISSVLWQDR